MITKMFHSLYRAAPAALLLLALAATAPLRAGTPLICFPYEIGQAKSLPGGDDGPKGTSAKYDRSHLAADTIALLQPEMPVIVRMETIRRAVVYATKGELFSKSYPADDKKLVASLLAALQKRADLARDPMVIEQGTVDKDARALALFDLGFYSETLRQAGVDSALNGYSLLAQAAELRGPDAEMEFALALASSWPRNAQFESHLAKAKAGSAQDKLLAANVASHLTGS